MSSREEAGSDRVQARPRHIRAATALEVTDRRAGLIAGRQLLVVQAVIEELLEALGLRALRVAGGWGNRLAESTHRVAGHDVGSGAGECFSDDPGALAMEVGVRMADERGVG